MHSIVEPNAFDATAIWDQDHYVQWNASLEWKYQKYNKTKCGPPQKFSFLQNGHWPVTFVVKSLDMLLAFSPNLLWCSYTTIRHSKLKLLVIDNFDPTFVLQALKLLHHSPEFLPFVVFLSSPGSTALRDQLASTGGANHVHVQANGQNGRPAILSSVCLSTFSIISSALFLQ